MLLALTPPGSACGRFLETLASCLGPVEGVWRRSQISEWEHPPCELQ